MKLYWGSGSPFSWRAMLALIVKGAEFDDQRLHFDKKEHKSPEYLAINPRGRVPTLVDGETVVRESSAIIGYIDRKIPQVPLFGRTPAETARIMQTLSEHDAYAYPAGIELLRPIFRGKSLEKTDDVVAAAKALDAEYGYLRSHLETGPWLGGDAVSAADITVYPTLMLVDRIVGKPEIAALELNVAPFASPSMRAWKERVEAIPGIDRAHPPHWRT